MEKMLAGQGWTDLRKFAGGIGRRSCRSSSVEIKEANPVHPHAAGEDQPLEPLRKSISS